MRTAHKKVLSVAAAIAAIGLVSGCGSATAPTAPAADAGPVTIDVWGWDAESTPNVVAAYNASQDKIKVNYVLQASLKATQTNFRNVMESKKDIPCYLPGIGPMATTLVNGWAQDVTEYVEPIKDVYSKGAQAAAQVEGKFFGFPAGPSATFMMANKAVYEKYGLAVPKTWEEFVTTGKELKKHGVTVMNLAGEDPSTLLQMSQQAGASWFEIDGDKWKVNLQDDATMKAVDIIQQMVDNDLVAHQTYQDRPALYSYFDSGQLATVPLAWWSMAGYQTNFKASLGQWEAVDVPQFKDAKEFVSSGMADPGFVPVGCENPAAAIEYVHWVASSKEAIEAGRNKKTGAIGVPAHLADVSTYTEDVVPDKIFGAQPAAEVGKVIAKAQNAAVGKFERGPNYDAWFPEMQDQWGKAMAKQITLKEAMANVQTFITKDLDSKGIKYEVSK
ncbi:ABC transporter substrate-binding protein [Arthrobacter sp. R4-81]